MNHALSDLSLRLERRDTYQPGLAAYTAQLAKEGAAVRAHILAYHYIKASKWSVMLTIVCDNHTIVYVTGNGAQLEDATNNLIQTMNDRHIQLPEFLKGGLS